MHLTRVIRGAICAAPFLLAACGGSDSKFDLVLLHADCDAAGADVFPSSGTIEIEVSGDGMEKISSTASLGDKGLEVPEIPNGSNRVASVRVFDQGSGSAKGSLRAVGRSAPFSVSDSDTPSVTVQMYRVGGFTMARNASGACANLSLPRSGHTATLLQDGRVLIAGGFRNLEAGKETDVNDTAEVFDPVTGAFTSAGKMCADGSCARAHGQAALLRDGRVLVVGGIDGSGKPTATAVVYDPAKNAWSAAGSMEHPRRGHTATLLGGRGDGPVVVVGGVDESGTIVESVELFDPATNAFGPMRDPSGKNVFLARAYHAAANVGSTLAAVQVIGGIDGAGEVLSTIYTLSWDQGAAAFRGAQETKIGLEAGVVGAGLATFQDRLATVGGASKWTADGAAGDGKASDPVKKVQWFDKPMRAEATGTADGQLSRTNPCVAMLDGDRALVVGGFAANGAAYSKGEVIGWQDAPDPANPGKTIRVLRSGYTENLGRLRDDGGRGWGTCTDLGEGRVLVAGGIGANGASVKSVEIFVAAPLAK